MKSITIRYEVETNDGRTTIREKSFKGEAAMITWVERQEATNPKFVRVVAYSA